MIFDSDRINIPDFSGIIGTDGTVRVRLDDTGTVHVITPDARMEIRRNRAGTRSSEQKEIKLWGGSYGLLAPVDRDGDGVFDLRCIQQVRGESNADRVAEIRSVLAWSKGAWEVVETEVAPLGPDGRPVE